MAQHTFKRALLVAKNVEKSVGDSFTIAGLSFKLFPGDCMCVIDTERHCASLLIRVLGGLVPADAGILTIDGKVITGKKVPTRLVGFMASSSGAYQEFTIQEYMNFLAESYDIDLCYRPFLIREALETVKLRDSSHEPIDQISDILRRRLALARALLNDPRVLIAEDPLQGLDYAEEREFTEIFRSLRARGKTLVISTANVHALEELCTHVCLIIRGRLIACGALEQVAPVLARIHSIQIQVLDNVLLARNEISSDWRVHHVMCRENIIRFIFEGAKDELDDMLRELTARGISIVSFSEDLQFLGNLRRSALP